MPRFETTRVVRHSPETMFNLVADIERDGALGEQRVQLLGRHFLDACARSIRELLKLFCVGHRRLSCRRCSWWFRWRDADRRGESE
jgi:hypothetical protein